MTTTVLEQIHAADVMQKDLCWAEPGETLGQAARRMHDRGLRCLLVRAEPGSLPGIVTSKDVVNAVTDQGPDALQTVHVEDVMTAPAICAPSAATLTDCVKLMRLCGVRRLPVLDGLQVVGLLSSSDVFARILRR